MAALWLRGGTDARPFAVIDSFGDRFHDWVAEVDEYTTPAPDSVSSEPIPDAISASKVSPGQSRRSIDMSPADHASDDSSVCNIPRTKSRSDVDANLVYKWQDEDGQTHLSDTRPAGVIASVSDMSMAKRDFTYEIIPDGVSLPIDFQGQLGAGSKRIYDTWHFFLGEDKLRQSHIKLVLIGGPDRFDAYHAKTSPNSKPVNGFYSMSKNQAVVKFDSRRPEQTLATTFHETSHLITASHLGPTPPWLTEGLAEYFETMKVKGQGGAIYPNQAHIKLLKTTPIPRLRDYLNIDRPQWHGDNRSRNYAIAWSLVHYLMQGSPGMYAMQDLVLEAHANFCKPFSAIDALAKAYPGGLQRLEADWRKWLADGNFQVQQT